MNLIKSHLKELVFLIIYYYFKFSCGNFLEKNSYAASGVLEKLHIDFLRWTDG